MIEALKTNHKRFVFFFTLALELPIKQPQFKYHPQRHNHFESCELGPTMEEIDIQPF